MFFLTTNPEKEHTPGNPKSNMKGLIKSTTPTNSMNINFFGIW